MNIDIIILTSNTGFFGQELSPWVSINLDKVRKYLEKKYYIKFLTYDDIQFLDISNKYIVYTSTQERNLKGYYEDILFYLKQRGNVLIPNFNIFKCHDNKGFQELYKKLLSIKSIKATYHASDIFLNQQTNYPVVFKSPDGAASSSVTLINDQKALEKRIIRTKSEKYDICITGKIIKQYIKKYICLKKVTKSNLEYFRPKAPYVLQDYIPDLTHDFKVLIFWDKFYVLKRSVRANDFRASGSGNFHFEEIEFDLLDFAEIIFNKMKVPFISLDICCAKGIYYLIEFQGVHFGPYTLLFSDYYYKRNGNQWDLITGKSCLEVEFSRSIDKYITNIGNIMVPGLEI